MFLLGSRSFAMFLAPGSPSATTGSVYNDEFLAAEIGQVGTQFDGLGHIGRQVQMVDGTQASVFYNGVTMAEMRSRYGLAQLGVENMKPYLTRGILIDVAGYRGVETLPNEYRASVADVHGALAAQGFEEDAVKPGDALLFNLGWSGLWEDPDRMRRDWSQRPGVDQEVLDWIVERRPSVVGWDAAADDAGHVQLIMMNGIPNLELMDFEGLLADRVYEFMFVFTPLRLKGATGSPGRPLAIR